MQIKYEVSSKQEPSRWGSLWSWLCIPTLFFVLSARALHPLALFLSDITLPGKS